LWAGVNDPGDQWFCATILYLEDGEVGGVVADIQRRLIHGWDLLAGAILRHGTEGKDKGEEKQGQDFHE
jgi:hypothetical protein